VTRTAKGRHPLDADSSARAGSLLQAAVEALTSYRAFGAEQQRLRSEYLRHLAEHPDGIWKSGPPAHLTASCFVLDPSAENVLLTLHRKGGFWVQFGGHLEPADTSLAQAALREANEESGVPGLVLLPKAQPQPVGLHRHPLSAAFGRCREHLDVAYVAIAESSALPGVSDESDDVAWWPVGRLPVGTVPDLSGRLAAVLDVVRAAE
jgi:8-oxo-dGTP pyrophosphatase MutT (NUDIX family)